METGETVTRRWRDGSGRGSSEDRGSRRDHDGCRDREDAGNRGSGGRSARHDTRGSNCRTGRSAQPEAAAAAEEPGTSAEDAAFLAGLAARSPQKQLFLPPREDEMFAYQEPVEPPAYEAAAAVEVVAQPAETASATVEIAAAAAPEIASSTGPAEPGDVSEPIALAEAQPPAEIRPELVETLAATAPEAEAEPVSAFAEPPTGQPVTAATAAAARCRDTRSRRTCDGCRTARTCAAAPVAAAPAAKPAEAAPAAAAVKPATVQTVLDLPGKGTFTWYLQLAAYANEALARDTAARLSVHLPGARARSPGRREGALPGLRRTPEHGRERDPAELLPLPGLPGRVRADRPEGIALLRAQWPGHDARGGDETGRGALAAPARIPARLPRPRPAARLRPRVRPAVRRAGAARNRAPRARPARLPYPPGRLRPHPGAARGAAQPPRAEPRQGVLGRRGRRVGREDRPQRGGAARVRLRGEDRRLLDRPLLRKGRPGARRHPGQRPGGQRRHGQREDHRRGAPAPHGGDHRRCAGRDLPAAEPVRSGQLPEWRSRTRTPATSRRARCAG